MLVKIKTNNKEAVEKLIGKEIKELFPNTAMYFIEESTTEIRRLLYNTTLVTELYIERDDIPL